MENNLQLEKELLKQKKSAIQDQINILKDSIEKNKSDIMEQKKQMREETKHSISGSLWNSDNFSQLVELSQFASQVSDTISKYESNVIFLEKLEKSLKKPYFARINFKPNDEYEYEKIYIGRLSIMDDENYTLIIYDWRSPIASTFYRFGLGRVFYEAPVGRVYGDVNLKRQYEIRNGELDYFFDTDIQILDEFLGKLLSQNSSPKMKSIIETIQSEQDIIIRNMDSDLLMVQGGAGSGKTSVALHRIAYLMYQGLSKKLPNHNIAIISPNLLFEEYISNVLPELGEENITSFLLDEILENILKIPFQRKNQLYELLITNDENNCLKENLDIKTSSSFIDKLNSINLSINIPLQEIINVYEELTENTFSYVDASNIVYLYLKSNKNTDYLQIKQVVIDEAQDYYPIHFEILNLLFPNARFTILGDINQTIKKKEDISFYDKIQNIFDKKKASLVSLTKSFRCGYEILEFSSKFTDTKIDAFNRHCEEPKIYKLHNRNDLTRLIDEINICKENGFKSIGILCKSYKEALTLFHDIKDKIDVSIIEENSVYELVGTFILPIYLSKGLEFDTVLIWNVNNLNYTNEDDRQLLYIACTRALHRLNLFYFDNISPLLE